MHTKDAIRRELLERRRTLDPADALRMSAAVRSRLWDIPEFLEAERVLTYVSAKNNEVDTRGTIEALLGEGRQVACAAVGPGRDVVWRRIESLDDLTAGRFGIPEPDPQRCETVAAHKSAVVLVPGVAFSRDGHRIGYGGGYFDRFLGSFPGTSIGLAYDFQVVGVLPREAHDVPVDILATECGTYRARAKLRP